MSRYQDYVNALGCEAYYPLSESSGTTIADISGNSNDGTFVGGITAATGSPAGVSDGIAFDGVADAIELPASVGEFVYQDGNGAVAFWYKGNIDGTDNFHPIIGNSYSSASGNIGWSIYFDDRDSQSRDNAIIFFPRDSNSGAADPAIWNNALPADDDWHFILFAMSSTEDVSLWIDGVNITPNAGDLTSMGAANSQSRDCTIGAINMAARDYGASSLSDVALINGGGLSTADVQTLYTMGRYGPEHHQQTLYVPKENTNTVTDMPVPIDLASMNTAFRDTVANGGGDIRIFDQDDAELPRQVVSCVVEYSVPTVAASTTFAANGQDHGVTLPSDIQEGDIVFLLAVVDNGQIDGVPTGWTNHGEIIDRYSAHLNAASKICDGTEGSTTALIETTVSDDFACCIAVVRGADAVYIGTSAHSNGTSGINLASATASWDERNTLWIIGSAESASGQSLSTWPSGYTQIGTSSTSGNNTAEIAEEAGTTTEDPSSIWYTGNITACAALFGFRPSVKTGTVSGKVYVKKSLSSLDTKLNALKVFADGISADYAVTHSMGRNAVWSDYRGVYHGDLDSNNDLIDSAGNYDAVGSGTVTAANESTGDLGPAVWIDNVDYFTATAAVCNGWDFTLQGWYNRTNSESNIYALSVYDKDASTEWSMVYARPVHDAYAYKHQYGGGTTYYGTADNNTQNEWVAMHATFSSSTLAVYANAAKTSGSMAGGTPTTHDEIGIGYVGDSTPSYSSSSGAWLSELRVRESVLSDEWITTEVAAENNTLISYEGPIIVAKFRAENTRTLTLGGTDEGNVLLAMCHAGVGDTTTNSKWVPSGWTELHQFSWTGAWGDSQHQLVAKVSEGNEASVGFDGPGTRPSCVGVEVARADLDTRVIKKTNWTSSVTGVSDSAVATADNTLALSFWSSHENYMTSNGPGQLTTRNSFPIVDRVYASSFGGDWCIAALSQGPNLYNDTDTVTTGWDWPLSGRGTGTIVLLSEPVPVSSIDATGVGAITGTDFISAAGGASGIHYYGPTLSNITAFSITMNDINPRVTLTF